MFSQAIIPVIVIKNAQHATALGQTLVDNGLPIAEVTLRTESALLSIQAMSQIEGLQVGAGTVLTVEQARQAIESGATFLVSPGIHQDVIEYAQSQSIPIIPGITSPSEMAKAIDLGLDTVKFFPAEALGGIKLLKAIASVYPHIKIMPTGGISPSNVLDYLALDSVIACGGSWMVPEDLVKAQDFDTIAGLIKEAVQLSTPLNN